MRRLLNCIYEGAAWLAGLFMIGILVFVLWSIIIRQMGTNFPGLDAYAGYSMAAAGFLALASTFRHNEHIRVTLILAALKPRARHYLNLFTLVVAIVLSGALAWFSIKLVMDSYSYHDLSTGEDATPLWIPQLGMAAGCLLFCIAIVDEFICSLKKGYSRTEEEPVSMQT